jgi:ubiquinone/menaquinone biosynthesis C-methylase UbiE
MAYKNKFKHISDQLFDRFITFGERYPDIVTCDHILQKLIIFDFISGQIKNHNYDSILEIGCGFGLHSALLSTMGSVDATELASPGSFVGADGNVSAGRGKIFEELASSSIRFCHNDGRRLPYSNEYFDLVYHNSVIEHVPNISEFLIEIRRVLKPGGVIVCVTGTPMLCVLRYLRDYLLLLPLIAAKAVCYETGIAGKRNAAEKFGALLSHKESENAQQLDVSSFYPQLQHYLDSPDYNQLVLEEIAGLLGTSTDNLLSQIYLHFRKSLRNRLRFYFTPPTHGQHYRDVWHEMKDWRVSRWTEYFMEAGYEIPMVVPYRFHHLFELTRNLKVNTYVYYAAIKIVRALSVIVPPGLASEFIMIARKPRTHQSKML